MAKDKKGGLWALLGLLGLYLSSKQPKKPAQQQRMGTATTTGATGVGGSTYTPSVTGFVITGIGQTVTNLTIPQTVTLPARVINILTTPRGIYSGSVVLKTQSGTVLHTETLTDLNFGAGVGAYPAIYFNPQNSVWNIPVGTYVMQVFLTIDGNLYTRSIDIILTNDDLGLVGGGTSGVQIQDYSTNGNAVTLTLTGGTNGQNVTILLKQDGTVVGTLSAAYASTMTITTSSYGYCDVFVDNTDLGAVYVPFQLSGNWIVEKAKSVDETDVLNLQFSKVGNSYIVTDNASNSGWANVEYWHNATFLGASIPSNYAIEPLTIHNITKKRWGNFSWLGSDSDGLNRNLAQLTFKIVPQ